MIKLTRVRMTKQEEERYPLLHNFPHSAPFSRSVMSNSLQPHEPQHDRPPCPSQTPGVYSNPCPSSRWCYPTISSSVVPSLPVLNLSQHQGFFQWVGPSHQVVKVLELQLQHQSFQGIFRTDFFWDWLVWSLCIPKESQEFSITTVWKHQFFST